MSAGHDGGHGRELAASLTLLGAAVAALVLANSALSPEYKALLDTRIVIAAGPYEIADPLKVWIKNALMAVFFLAVGLEIKAEFMEGALADAKRAALPLFGALGGMAVPALLYLLVVGFTSDLARGWAIPSATDIAFAIGVVGLLGSKVPPALKAFLLAVAVIDDLGAILIIAFFYTAELNLVALAWSAGVLAALGALNVAGVTRILPYMLLGVVLWLCVLSSGINPTLAGVLTALFVPLAAKGGGSPLHGLEHKLRNPVVFGIMPLFAFANAGVPLYGLGLADILEPVTAGVALGLAAGKPIGVTLAVFLAVRLGMAKLPEGAGWRQILGIGCIAGIGFTMSLFIGALAFEDEALVDQVRLGVLTGSLVATLAGVALLATVRGAVRAP